MLAEVESLDFPTVPLSYRTSPFPNMLWRCRGPPTELCRKNVVKNSGTTVKNSTVKNRKSSVSYTITYFLPCFARQAWLLWRFGVRQPPESGIQDPGSSCWMADGCTKFGREGAGTFQCPRPLYIGRNLTYPVPWHLSMPRAGPCKGPTTRSRVPHDRVRYA